MTNWREVTAVRDVRDLAPEETIRVNGEEKTVGAYYGLSVAGTPLLEALWRLGHKIERQES